MSDILAIVGSVRFTCPDGLIIARNLICGELDRERPGLITSGGAVGVDTLAEQAAAKYRLPSRIYRPTVRRWAGSGGFAERNLRIARACTRLLRIACAESRTFGSGWTALQATKLRRPVRTVIVGRDGTFADSGWPDKAAQLDLLDMTIIGGM